MKRDRRIAGALAAVAALGLLVAYLWPSASKPLAAAPAGAESSLREVQRAFMTRLGGADAASAVLSGRVHAGGNAVAGALVCAACAGCEGTTAPPSPCARSGADGAYAFDRLAAGAYFVHATAAGYLPGSAAGGDPIALSAGTARSGVDVALEPGGARLAGEVIDATGGPVPHARVRAVRTIDPRVSLDVETDDAGRFALSVGPGFILLVAEADGYAPARMNAIAPRSDVSLMLTPAAVIAGKVVSARDDEPVPGIEVRAVPVRNRNAPVFRSAVSDEDGRFTILGLSPDTYQLVAKGDRHHGETPEVVELGLGQRADDALVRVFPAAEVIGRVVDESGAPCRQGFAGLGVPDPHAPMPDALRAKAGELAGQVGPEQIAEIQSDGSVHFRGVPPGSYFVTMRCRERLLRAGPQLLEVRAEPITGLTWTVSAAATLRVTVVDARHRPQPNARFVLTWPRLGGDQQPVSVLTSDARGEHVLHGVAAGSYGVGPYDGVLREPELTVDVREGAAASEVVLVVKGSGTILLEVRTAAGAAINDLHVMASEVVLAPVTAVAPGRMPATALGDGRFAIGPLPAGRYTVSAEDGIHPAARVGGAQGEVVVRDGEQTRVELVLERSAALAGTVVDASGAPAANVWVSAEHTPGEAGASSGGSASLLTSALSGASKRVLSDLDGRFRLEGIAGDARYTLRAVDPFGSAVVLRDVAPSERLALRLLMPGSISGLLLDREGQPARHYNLQLRNTDTGTGLQRTIADEHGRFTLPELAPGPIELTFWTASGDSATHALELAAGQDLSGLSIALEPAGALAAASAGPAAAPTPTPAPDAP